MNLKRTPAPDIAACPWCGGGDFRELENKNHEALVWRADEPMIRGLCSGLIYTVCLQCGSIVHVRVDHVDEVLTQAEKEARK
ncbi:MAG: hypothetical protein IJ157_14630 [Clostridia bacterium]|nr:hypothetical protein [Clostridia bacterium]